MLLAIKPDLFTIGTIILLELKILAVMAINAKTSSDAKIGTITKTDIDMKISIDESIFDFPHTLGEILVDTTPTWIKV